MKTKYSIILLSLGFLMVGCNPKKKVETVISANEDVGNLIKVFSENYKSMLDSTTTGWSYQIWHKKQLVINESGGFRIAKVDSKDSSLVKFNATQRMHVASISKTITAIATAKILNSKGLDWETKIAPLLPKNWSIHPSLANTTFAELLEMKSGLVAQNDALSSSYHSLQDIVAKGVDEDNIGNFNYQNISYGLLRVLIAELHGFNFNRFSTDSITLATASANSYVNYVNKEIFEPAGIPYASCRELSELPTLMYPYPYNSEQGLITGYGGFKDSDGDLTLFSGGLGWYLSVDDLGKLFSTFFHTNDILPKNVKDSLFTRSFPFNKGKQDWGEYFSGMGMWIWSKPYENYNCGLNTVYVLFPDDILLIAFVNSKGKGIKNLKAKAIMTYTKSLEK